MEVKDKPKVEKKEVTPSQTYLRANRYAGLKFQLNKAIDGDPTTVKYAGFVVVSRKVNGYDVNKGFLATSDKDLIKRATKRGYVEEITEKQYNNKEF